MAELSFSREILDAESRRLMASGYTVYSGQAALLPEQLRHLHPDAIAVGREPKLIIEVVTEGSTSSERLKQIRREVAQIPGWELRVILDRGAREKPLEKMSIETIESSIGSAREAVQSGLTAAALLLAWGTLEAVARHVVPDEISRPQTPGRLVQVLASRGLLDLDQERLLRRLAKTRNAIIHGELSTNPSAAEVAAFLDVVSGLLARAAQPFSAS